jgi:hypothetical protein
MNEEIKELVFQENNVFIRRMITKKYIDYKKDKDIQGQVYNCISNVFDKKKDEAIKISNNIADKIINY